ncbi:MAG: YccF domain-containing protein, partial [Halorubrum sp.]
MAQRSLLVRALWFAFVGWWATPIVVNTAWLLNVTVVLLPLGIKLINLVPTALTLAEP